MKELLSEDEMYTAVREGLPHGQDLTDYEYSIMGRVSTGLTLLEGNFSPGLLSDVYRTGGMYGVLIERVDDVIDSDHGSKTVNEMESFLERGVEVIRTGQRPESYEPVEEASFIAAEKVNRLLEGEEEEEFAERMQELSNVILDEESAEDGYERHIESSELMFDSAAYLVEASTGYSPDEGLWRQTGRLLQLTDDRVDQDQDRTDEQMHEMQRQVLGDIRSDHGLKVALPVKASEKLIREVGKISARN